MTDPVAVGDVVGGKYVVHGVLGRGGIGVVVAAEHMMLRRRVALKFLRPELTTEPDVVQRFLREGRAAAQLRSEHVARVIDADTTDCSTPYIEKELLQGRDLAAVLKDEGPRPLGPAVDYVMQACEAVAEAHAVGILHRDLKTANLFLTRSAVGLPLVKVLDFGLSKIEDARSDAGLTSDNHVFGSPHFMSPEQMRASRDADARSDIWALGVVLYTCLAGRVPFEGGYLTEVCSAVLSCDAPRLASLRPEVPAGLEEVVGRCLRLEPEDRFQSVLQLVEALAPFGGAAGAERATRIARLVAERGGPGSTPSDPTAQAPPPPLAPGSRSRVGRRLLVAALGGLLAVGAFALWRRPSNAQPPQPILPAVASVVAPVAVIEPAAAPPPSTPPPAVTAGPSRPVGARARDPGSRFSSVSRAPAAEERRGCHHGASPLTYLVTHPRTLATTLTVLAAAAALGVCTIAHAAPAPEKTAAEMLDAEGTALMQDHRYAEACPKLAESQRLEPGTGVLLRLGLCNEQLGKTASAWSAFREAAARATRSGDEPLRQLATKRADGIAPRVPRVMLVPAPGTEHEPVGVTCDGAVLDGSVLGTEIPMDPGTHSVQATLPGHKTFRTTFTLESRGTTISIPLDLPPEGAAVRTADSGRGNVQRTTALAVGGVGLAGLIMGGILGLSAMSSWNQARSECTGGLTGCSESALSLQSVVHTDALWSTVGFAVGGAGLLGAAILWWTAPNKGADPMHVGYAVDPLVGADRLGLLVSGDF